MIETQMSLPLGRAKKRAGQSLALAAEPSPFRVAAQKALTKIANTQGEMTSDDLWRELPEGMTPEHPNCVGGLFRWAAGAGLIEATGRIRPSAKISSHARNVLVWRSLVFYIDRREP